MTEQKPRLDTVPLEHQGPVHFKSRSIAMKLKPRDIIGALVEMFKCGDSPTEPEQPSA